MKLLLNKKAAMFGLDARIALAIFGALSVISGAALYSAIQNAKVVQWQTYFSELNKASAAYYLDTGSQIPISSDYNDLMLAVSYLLSNDNNTPGWKGPYWKRSGLDYENVEVLLQDYMTKTIGDSSVMTLVLKQTSNWDPSIDSDNVSRVELCVLNSTDCAEWWFLNPNMDEKGYDKVEKLSILLDQKVDGGDGAYAGNIRYSSKMLLVKGRPRVYKGN